jgi:hypothetical protein
MKHQQYETWIFSGDELTAEQLHELQSHLKECEACKEMAMAEKSLQLALTSASMMKPMPGFVQRWKAKVERRRLTIYHRQTASMLGLLSLGASVLFLPLMLQTIFVLLSPDEFLIDVVKVLVNGISSVGLIGEFTLTFFGSLFRAIPVLGWIAMAMILAGMGTMSIFSLYRIGLIPIRKGVQK